MATVTEFPIITLNGSDCTACSANSPIEFEVTDGSPSADSFEVAIYLATAPVGVALSAPIDFNGSTFILDVAPYLRSYLNNDSPNLTNPTGTTAEISSSTGGNTVGFAFPYRLGVKDYGAGSFNITTEIFIAFSNAKQSWEKYGQNLADFWPYVTGSPPSVDVAGNFLTRFATPILWHYQNIVLLPELAFIVPAILEDIELVISVTIGANTEVLQAFTPIYMGGAYCTFFGAVLADFVQDVQESSTATIAVYLSDNASPAGKGDLLINPITFEIRQACFVPLFVKWKDELGSFHIWAFEGRKPRTVQTKAGDVYLNFATAPSTPTGGLAMRNYVGRTFDKQAEDSYLVMAQNLSLDQAKALATIATSPNVMICFNEFGTDTIADRWFPCLVDGAPVIDTYDAEHKVSYTFTVGRNTITN